MQDSVIADDAIVTYHLKSPPREMSVMENAVNIEITEVEPTQEEVELQAAKQLMLELQMIKKRIYDSRTLINSMLIVQVKQLLRGLISKYNAVGLFEGENITLRLSNRSKHANIGFVFSPKLHLLMDRIVAELPKPGVEVVQPIEKEAE